MADGEELAGGGVLQLNHLAVPHLPPGRVLHLSLVLRRLSLGVRGELPARLLLLGWAEVRRVGLEGAELLRRRIHLLRHQLEHRALAEGGGLR